MLLAALHGCGGDGEDRGTAALPTSAAPREQNRGDATGADARRAEGPDARGAGESRSTGSSADPTDRGFAATFTDEAAPRGLTGPNHCGEPEAKVYAVEEIGQGAALFDYDGDGDLDAYVVDGCRVVPPGTPVDAPDHLQPPSRDDDWRPAFDGMSRLYQNDGRGHFTDVTANAGCGYAGMGMGVTTADYDGDGDPDLYLTCWGPNRLFRNDGGTFTDVTEAAQVGDPTWSVGSCWLDAEGDGDLDLYVANYFALTTAMDPEVWDKIECPYLDLKAACGPKTMVGLPDRLYLNQGDGTFVDASEERGIHAVEARYGLGVVAFDYDLDGDTDVYVANDSRGNYLFENDGTGHFTELADMTGTSLSRSGVPQAGMGVACGDYDGDGDSDLFLTNFSRDYNTLYSNEGLDFLDISRRIGFSETDYFSLGWGTEFLDLDQDGRLDLFLCNGHVYPEADLRAPELSYRQHNRLYANRGALLVDVTDRAGPGLQKRESSRGMAAGDVDEDGDLDLLIVEMNAPPTLLINGLSDGGHFLQVSLEGAGANRDALGAKVTATSGGLTQHREARRGQSFASCHDPRLHFGLGAATSADLSVTWPDGTRQEFPGVAADHWVHLRQGQPDVEVRR